MSESYDIEVIGGGPAGASCARRLAEWGRRVALRDRSRQGPVLPQETLVDSARPLLEAWGLLDVVAQRWPGTPRHAVVWGDDEMRWRVGSDVSPGYKIERKEFDRVLRSRAEEAGVDVVTRAEAALTVVATGKEAPPTAAGARVEQELPRTVALFGFVDAPDAWANTTVIEAVPEGWWWWLPLKEGSASLALLADAAEVRDRGVESVVATARAASLGPAKDLAPPSWSAMNATPRLRTPERDHLLIGDAASTIDPLSSQGVEKALASAEEAAFVVNTLLSQPKDRDALLAHQAAWERDLFEAHAHRALAFYGRERRFPDAPFWKRRHALLDEEADDEMPDRVARAPGLVPAVLWRRGDRVLVSEAGRTVGAASPLSRIADVPLGPLLELVDEEASVADIVRRAASRPELYLSTPKRVEGALKQLYRRGFLGRV